MAKGQFLTPYQKGIVRRYYEHKETLMTQKLGELVSELYVCQDERRAGRLWERARRALLNAGANRVAVEKLLADRSVERLAKMVGELF